jgi:hypothetical protein
MLGGFKQLEIGRTRGRGIKAFAMPITAFLAAVAALNGIALPAQGAEPARPCGVVEGFQVLAASPRTTCEFAWATTRKIRRRAFNGGVPPRFSLRVLGRTLACTNTHPDRGQRFNCQGRERRVLVEYISPRATERS